MGRGVGVGVLLFAVHAAVAERPMPVGESTVTVEYETAAGPVSFQGDRNYLGDAVGPGDATVLGAAPNITAFNSVNSFGRRTALANTNPVFADVLGPDESLVTHAFFKNVPGQMNDAFFSDIVEDGDVTFTVEGIEFNRPVSVVEDTFLMHLLWNGDQADRLNPPYINVHNHHTGSASFRDEADFLAGGIFSEFPSNTTFGTVSPVFEQIDPNTLGFSITIPYSMLRHLEDQGQSVPDGLPAPQGFLEPFHLHFEYVVTPEPGTLALLLGAVLVVRRRGRWRGV
jgi:hypothetical protein